METKTQKTKEDAWLEEHNCCICGEMYQGYGNNAWPLDEGRCCDVCNFTKVLLARLRRENNKQLYTMINNITLTKYRNGIKPCNEDNSCYL